MLKRKTAKKHTDVAVFKMHIDFNPEVKEEYGLLLPGREYRFLRKQREKAFYASYEEIVQFVTNILNNELVEEYNKSTLLHVSQIEVMETYKGSIEILFSVIFDTLGVISGLKDLYDCIELIKELTTIHVTKRMEREYGDNFKIRTYPVVPKEEIHKYKKSCKHHSNCPILTTSDSCKRDAFFYYLLISNIVLLTILILLVYKAVITMYW